MLTVLTPATSTRLTTVTRARALLGFAAADDAAVDLLIGQASRAIADYCLRPFGLETLRETFYGHGQRHGFQLSRSPVTAIASVVRDGTALDTTEYAFDPLTGRLIDTIDGFGCRFQWWWGETLIVDYTAGYVLPSDANGAPASTLPEPVERAAILIVGAYLSTRSRDPHVKREEVAGVGQTIWADVTGALPSPEAEQLLQPYRRIFG